MIGSSIVVEVGESGSPGDEAVVDGQTGVNADVLKLTLSNIAVKVRNVAGKVRLEQVEMSLTAGIGHSHSHARLLLTVVTVGHSAQGRLLPKSSVPVVHEEQGRRRVAGYVNVRPAIVVEIGSNDGETVGVASGSRYQPSSLTSVNVPSPLFR